MTIANRVRLWLRPKNFRWYENECGYVVWRDDQWCVIVKDCKEPVEFGDSFTKAYDYCKKLTERM